MGKYPALTGTNNCIFCEIVATHDPKTFFWEDDEFMAMLSIDPNTPGFSLVIPKEHYGSDVIKMPDHMLQKFIIAAKKTAKILEDFYPDVGRVGIITEGSGIDHAHIKLFPMHGTEHLKRGEWKQNLTDVEHWFDTYEGWMSSAGGPNADREKLLELTDQLRKSQE